MAGQIQPRSENSGQSQTVRHKKLEIPEIDCGQSCATTDRDRSDHAICQTAGSTARAVEQVCRKFRICGPQNLRFWNDLSGYSRSHWIQGATQEFGQSHRAHPEHLVGASPSTKSEIRIRSRQSRLDQKIGIEVNHRQNSLRLRILNVGLLELSPSSRPLSFDPLANDFAAHPEPGAASVWFLQMKQGPGSLINHWLFRATYPSPSATLSRGLSPLPTSNSSWRKYKRLARKWPTKSR